MKRENIDSDMLTIAIITISVLTLFFAGILKIYHFI